VPGAFFLFNPSPVDILLCVKHRMSHVLEYAGLRLFSGIFRWLPLPAAQAVGIAVAWISHHAVRFRRGEARRRLRTVFGETRTEKELRRIAWISWRNLCLNVIDLARLPRLTRAAVERHTEWRALQPAIDLAREGRGSVIAVPHAGN
jgi:lauroyl/myristoyl acyltransferase